MAGVSDSTIFAYFILVGSFLFVFLCLSGIGYSYLTSEDFPESCLQQYSPCYIGLILPVLVPVFVMFMYINWMGLKFFTHN